MKIQSQNHQAVLTYPTFYHFKNLLPFIAFFHLIFTRFNKDAGTYKTSGFFFSL